MTNKRPTYMSNTHTCVDRDIDEYINEMCESAPTGTVRRLHTLILDPSYVGGLIGNREVRYVVVFETVDVTNS